jgi:hypothetical protein
LHRLCNLPPTQLRQNHIGQQQVERALERFEDLERLLPISRREHRVSVFLE